MNIEVYFTYYIFTFLNIVSSSYGARILGIFPTPSISHQLVFQTIMKALAARGHQVTVISTDPLKTSIPNYTDIDISFSYGNVRTTLNFVSMSQSIALNIPSQLITILSKMTDDQLSSPQIKEFITRSNNTKFDLVFLETHIFQAYHGLIHLAGSPPVIGIKTYGYVWATADVFGTPTNPAFITDSQLPYSSHMTFFERLHNAVFWMWIRYKIYYELFPMQEEIMRKHFGAAPPPVHEAQMNMALYMVGTNFVFGYPIPVMPTVVNFHSLHIKTSADPLPKDLQNFLDEAKEGVIYFSLGTNVLGNHMSEEKRNAFISAFSELSQRVVWKWESEILPGQPENVKIGKWLPQQDILAHQNVRLFISQCGLQSFQEAVFHAVPILGIPFVVDQKFNAKKIENSGIGLKLSFQDVTKESLTEVINEILHNPRYKENMEKFSTLSKDEPHSSLEKIVWWTEHVVRHNGAKHLRSAALDLKWYQYLLLDVVVFVILIVLIIIFLLYSCIKLIYTSLLKKIKTKHE